ncbi:MAG: metal ABC transporter ATP-binding protein [Acidaminococcaceae bacterium]
MAEIIRINNLGYNFGDGWVLHDLSLTVEQGDFVAVIGANGAGKSTLLRLIAQILTPTLGEIYLYREPLALFKNWQKVGYVPQNPARQQKSFPISVEEVVSLGRLDGRSLFQRYTAEDRAAVRDIMERFNLMDLAKKKIGELSGGQQQRVFIARAMVNAPELLLLDEPATGVDPDAKEELYRLLGELNTKQGITIVMVSHDLELAAQVAKKALCLDHGICFWGNVQEALSHRHKHGYFYR